MILAHVCVCVCFISLWLFVPMWWCCSHRCVTGCIIVTIRVLQSNSTFYCGRSLCEHIEQTDLCVVRMSARGGVVWHAKTDDSECVCVLCVCTNIFQTTGAQSTWTLNYDIIWPLEGGWKAEWVPSTLFGTGKVNVTDHNTGAVISLIVLTFVCIPPPASSEYDFNPWMWLWHSLMVM